MRDIEGLTFHELIAQKFEKMDKSGRPFGRSCVVVVILLCAISMKLFMVARKTVAALRSDHHVKITQV